MAAVITLHSVRLATNANGALLLTWLLDTCNFPNRFKTLAPRLVPDLAKLCSHKLASLTVLKLINQRSEPEAREIILNALFNSDDDHRVLKRILEDQMHGPAVIYKVLTSPFVIDQNFADRRAQYVASVRTLLQKLKVQPNQAYKRLMDEVGLLTDRTAATPPINGHRGPPRSSTPRDYGSPNAYAQGAFYSPQHNYATSQQYVPQQQLDLLSRPAQNDTWLPMEMQNPGSLYTPQQISNPHQHQDSAQAAYQYQQMMMIQQRPYNGYTAATTTHQPTYQPSTAAAQSQFGGPLVPGNLPPQGVNVYGVNSQPPSNYPFDVYSGNRQRQR